MIETATERILHCIEIMQLINLDVTVEFDQSLCLGFFNKLEHLNHFTSVLWLGKSLLSDGFKFRDDSTKQKKKNTTALIFQHKLYQKYYKNLYKYSIFLHLIDIIY